MRGLGRDRAPELLRPTGLLQRMLRDTKGEIEKQARLHPASSAGVALNQILPRRRYQAKARYSRIARAEAHRCSLVGNRSQAEMAARV